MITFRCILSTGQMVLIEVEFETENTKLVLWDGDVQIDPDYWFGDRLRGGRQFIDTHGFTIMPEHIVMWKREED